jgi:tetratricopeptide (TPR) repeat protein
MSSVDAAGRDPNYARAYAGICMAYIVLPVYTDVPIDETRSRAVDAARRARAIDGTVAEAHAVLGLAIQNGVVEELFYARRYAEADSVSRAIMTLDSTFQLGLIFRARVLIELRKFHEAIAILERLSLEPSIRSAEKLGVLSYAYARAGHEASARATLARLSQDPLLSTSGEIATALDLLGERDSAVAMFRRAVAQHDQRIVAGSRSEPYDRLRTDPRLATLFAEIEAPN